MDSAPTRQEIDDLVNLAVDLVAEGERCAEAGVWRAAVLLLGGAVEAGIIATAARLDPRLPAGTLWPRKRDPLRWTLGEATCVAVDVGWLPVASGDTEGDIFAPLRGEVGDAVGFLVRVRNMVVHPGAYVREEVRPDFDDEQHMRPTYDILHGIVAEVFERLGVALRQRDRRPR